LVGENFTPPLKPSVKVPLPRPPAWIWDFTMMPPETSILASAPSNSAADLTATPLGTATPNFSKSSLAWYS